MATRNSADYEESLITYAFPCFFKVLKSYALKNNNNNCLAVHHRLTSCLLKFSTAICKYTSHLPKSKFPKSKFSNHPQDIDMPRLRLVHYFLNAHSSPILEAFRLSGPRLLVHLFQLYIYHQCLTTRTKLLSRRSCSRGILLA